MGHNSSVQSQLQPCREARERMGKQHSCAHSLQEASRTSTLHLRVSSCLQTPARKGWLQSQSWLQSLGCVLEEGSLCCCYPEDPLLHGWKEGGIPTPAALRGPWDSVGQQRAASSRKATAVCPYSCCWHSQVTAEVTVQSVALVKLHQKGNTAPLSLRKVLGLN